MLPDREEKSVWFGYEDFESAGIVHFDGDSVKKLIDDGLSSDRKTAIARDSSENLWFASRSGRESGWVTVLRDTNLTTLPAKLMHY